MASERARSPAVGDAAGLLRAGAAPLEGRRADAGAIRLTERHVTGLLWCAEMYGARADLLARLLPYGRVFDGATRRP